ncbi:MAG: polyphosphate kinase 1 [Phycisphaerae bacterium]|nr:polyphosphate kinase 1 [Phycisphaerae bacterium]|tara:strand:+ start:1567 stop:3822 length:2256 start_codon:yes stop_codon:yes gene_type:complete
MVPGRNPELNPTDARAESNFVGRDLGWLEFNKRVITEAEDPSHPLKDRLRFLAITASNLDEFFMKRIALLNQRVKTGAEKRTHDGLSVRQQLESCRDAIEIFQERQARIWSDEIEPELNENEIRLVKWNELDHEQRGRMDTWFHEMVFPILTPLAVDPGHPFPFISNLSLSIGVLISEPGSSTRQFARVKIPDGLSSWMRVPEEGPVQGMEGSTPATIISVCDIIENNLHEIFPGMDIHDTLLFRVTRGAGLEEDEEDIEDLMEFVQESLRHRRFAEAVRLETPTDPSKEIVDLLLDELELDSRSHYARSGLLDYTTLNDLQVIDRPDLVRPRWVPVPPSRLRTGEEDIFAEMRKRDILVHHPYESFDASVERFLLSAAEDKDVLAIKQSLYRTDIDSSFIETLIRAADSGKQVSCIVELRARFDEDQNMQLTRLLEKHGIHVAYGMLGYKTHAKTSLVVRREGDKLRSYAHIGTGNYHSGTARSYSDIGLLTCRTDLTNDLVELLNYLTGRSRFRDFKKLLIAPITMRDRFMELIQNETKAAEAGRPARIMAKMNQLEDPAIMNELIKASRAGVPVDLSVRGFCCLKPGIPGLTENIRVVSITGQFLEHSRVFHFANGEEDQLKGLWFIGSADWMKRNLDTRVEVVTPIEDLSAKRRLKRIMEVNFADRLNAWDMMSDGTYQRPRIEASMEVGRPSGDGTFLTLCQDITKVENRAKNKLGSSGGSKSGSSEKRSVSKSQPRKKATGRKKK